MSSSPVLASNTLAVLSRLPVASWLPSAFQATAKTQSLWLVIVSCSLPLATSNTRTTPSAAAVGQPIALRVEGAIEHHVAGHADDFDQLAAVGLEQPHFAVFARRAAGDRQKLTVRAEVNGIGPLADVGDAANQLAVGGFQTVIS